MKKLLLLLTTVCLYGMQLCAEPVSKQQHSAPQSETVENFKFIFKGTPFVKYADANGIIYMGPNFYNHKFDKLRAFGYTVNSYTGSNGKTYLVDNSPDTVLIVKDTLTADVIMTPNYVLNESDFGDATVMPVWDFDKPDSVALFKNFQGKCCFVKPTWFDSNYIDLNMSCDATNGWISSMCGAISEYNINGKIVTMCTIP